MLPQAYKTIHDSLVQQTFLPGLYIVSTPIGNLGDLSFRALEIFQQADVIFCEDTRVTGAFLKRLSIKKNLLSFHAHNELTQQKNVLKALEERKKVLLVSDAGTPLISDPGYKLVVAVQDAGFYVTAIPGPTAFVHGLVLSGLPMEQFSFVGFLPPKQQKKTIEIYKNVSHTLIFYEAPHRLIKTLVMLQEVLGDRKVVLARELTKKFEQIIKGTFEELIRSLSDHLLKGEFVVMVSGADLKDIEISHDLCQKILDQFSIKEGAAHLSKISGMPKRDAYQKLLNLK